MRTQFLTWFVALVLIASLYLLGPVLYFNRVYPYILGMPAILFWYTLVPVLTPLILGTLYLIHHARDRR